MGIISVILGIFAIGVIALIHEVGHYFFARRAGIKVLDLSIGAGPKIISFTKNGTDYSIRPIPFLAYVRLEESGEDGLANVSIFKRFLLYIGGVFFNIVTALFIITLIGIFSGISTDKVIVGELIKERPAYSILKTKDQILEVNGNKINGYSEFETQLKKNESNQLQLTVLRNQQEIKLNITPQFDKESNRYVLGFFFAKEKMNIFNSFVYSVKMISEYVAQTFVLLGNLITGHANASDNLVGVVGIVAITSDFTSRISDYMLFIAIISIGMAVINILPIPALDGGKIVLLGVEKIIGHKIDEKIESRLTIIGFAFLIMLMVFTTVNDLLKLFGG